MIVMFLCPNRDGFHERLNLYLVIPDGEPPVYEPTFKQWQKIRNRRQADSLRAYALTCPKCISMGLKVVFTEVDEVNES